MNCYYSNLIEGHETHPIEIERALCNQYSGDKRHLPLEAKAHIAVQSWNDAGGLSQGAASVSVVQEQHAHFRKPLPEELLWVAIPIPASATGWSLEAA